MYAIGPVSAREGEGGSENNFFASKAPIGPHIVAIWLKILDSVTSLGRTRTKKFHLNYAFRSGSLTSRLGEGIDVAISFLPAASAIAERATDVTDADLSDQIAQLEGDIEQLAETLERCRKAMLASQVAIGAGVIWILAYLIGAVGAVPTVMVGAIAAVIGGSVAYGSNASTSKEAAAAMMDAERLRTELIDKIEPRTIGGGMHIGAVP